NGEVFSIVLAGHSFGTFIREIYVLCMQLQFASGNGKHHLVGGLVTVNTYPPQSALEGGFIHSQFIWVVFRDHHSVIREACIDQTEAHADVFQLNEEML